MNQVKNETGISITELLIVFLIVAIVMLFTVTFYQDLNMRARDANRLSDLSKLQQAIQLALNDSAEKSEKSYYSLCSQVATPCLGSSFPVQNQTRKTDGQGWIKVNLEDKKIANYPTLPLDPINNEDYSYNYYSDGKIWTITAKLESNQYKSKMQNDNGKDPNKYEISQIYKN